MMYAPFMLLLSLCFSLYASLYTSLFMLVTNMMYASPLFLLRNSLTPPCPARCSSPHLRQNKIFNTIPVNLKTFKIKMKQMQVEGRVPWLKLLYTLLSPLLRKELTTILPRCCPHKYLFRSSQDEDETDEAGGSVEALHRALLPRLPLHLHDVRPHAQTCHAKVRVSALCSGPRYQPRYL